VPEKDTEGKGNGNLIEAAHQQIEQNPTCWQCGLARDKEKKHAFFRPYRDHPLSFFPNKNL
jgi:hypothetical protein